MQFVLVHGGWQAGWCWDAVSSVLRGHGHQVFAPTLRGSEEGEVDRSGVDLTMIGDGLVAAIKQKGLRDIVLVGHSGGGPAIQYAADRLVERTRKVIFVDAWVLHDGESIHDVLPRPLVDSGRTAAAKSPDRTVPMDPEVWKGNFMNGASDSQLAEVAKRLVPVPIGWLEEPISLPRFWNAALPSGYVFLSEDQSVPMEVYRAMAERLSNPRVVRCEGPHEAMLTHPTALAEALLTATGA
jgi:pimeloyl-ACP methyl ester carboxylesterase